LPPWPTIDFQSRFVAGQTVIVTGGGSGIGRCTAHELAALGAHVLLVGRKADKLEKSPPKLPKTAAAPTGTCDIREEDAVKQLVAN
jgi:citronellol/citronellal dehydrogenase